MKLALFMFFLMSFAHADPSWKWSNAVGIVEKHDYYQNNEIIRKPAGSWQILFAVLYHDANVSTMKDCLFYRVPGIEPGLLKLKTILSTQMCEAFAYAPGDEEWPNIKALQYSIQKNALNVSITHQEYQIERWDVPLFNVFKHPDPKPLMSSAELRAPRMIFLSPYKGPAPLKDLKEVAVSINKICHEIAEDCSETSPSTCSQCPQGWHEIPNGCDIGPKFCGPMTCGKKNGPACRRGMVYQRKDIKYSCREDDSFAYCSKGLRVQCHGNLAYCL